MANLELWGHVSIVGTAMRSSGLDLATHTLGRYPRIGTGFEPFSKEPSSGLPSGHAWEDKLRCPCAATSIPLRLSTARTATRRATSPRGGSCARSVHAARVCVPAVRGGQERRVRRESRLSPHGR